MQRSPSTPSENFEEELLDGISVEIWSYGNNTFAETDEIAKDILNYLRSKGVINNG